MLDWNRFKSLSGADTENFEKLCRGIVRRQFGNLGPLREIKNQPGVEFYVTLNTDHPCLGSKDETVGWQTKWFTYKANGDLTAAGKSQIEHSLNKTKEHVSHINHWYLWTHQTLAKTDQEWYYSLQNNYDFTLHLWNQDDLDALLSGQALDLRNTYFGELALTAEMLNEQHEKSVAPIRSRWLHDVHQQMSAEIKVRQILGEKEAWDEFTAINQQLRIVCEDIETSLNKPEYSRWAPELGAFYKSCKTYGNHCELFNNDICDENIEALSQTLVADSKLNNEILKASVQIRSQNLPLSLSLINAFAYIKDARNLFESAVDQLSKQCVVILADAGGGKTQLAAELTAQTFSRPAGILILGRSLKRNMGLDDLAKNFTFYQNQVNNFEALIAALNAVGERSKRRLPIVIDGLNEAQDPREWKALLESILPVLRKYLNVVLVCTLRTSEKASDQRQTWQKRHTGRETAANNSIPESAVVILSEGFDEELTPTAISSYFERYKINADQFTAPLDFFSHPLNLKIFCEVTNRKRESEVNVSYFPSSIYSLFREQIGHIANSIVNMTNLERSYQEADIEKAIYFFGECLWEANTRTAKEEVFKQKINFPSVDWNSDIVNLLSQEGMLFRDESEESFTYELSPVYDRLGGFIVAEYLIKKNNRLPLTQWVSETGFIEKLFGDDRNQHPLSEDILHALIVLIPKSTGGQLWKEVPTEIRPSILAKSHLIDKADFCEETINEYKSLIRHDGISTRDLEQLITLSFALNHPFNGEFLNEILLNLSMADRDLIWTEYLRGQATNVLRGLDGFLNRIRNGETLNPNATKIRLLMLSWYLTSTVAEVRDTASESLLEMGVRYPQTFFEVVLQLLKVNDPYVFERLLGAAYAVTTILINSSEYKDAVFDFARNIYNLIFTCTAIYPTTHIMAREYASCTLKMVCLHDAEIAKEFDPNVYSHPFSQLVKRPWGEVISDKEVYFSIGSPFRMDFENYTIGRLIKDRSNYDYSHTGYKNARGNILWRVYDLGWSHEKFEKVESLIESGSRNYSRAQRPTVERYGKKYSWIAYYELAGSLQDQGKLDSWGERFDADIDPFFPRETEGSEENEHRFLTDTTLDNKEWIQQSNPPDLVAVLEINNDGQQWVLLDGYISEESKRLDRSLYCSIDTAFISDQDLNALETYKREKKRIRWPDQSSVHYIYSGELYLSISNGIPNHSEIEVETSHETHVIERPSIYLGDKHILGGKTTEEVPVFTYLKLHSTSIKYYWENSHSSRENINQLVITPWIVRELDLRFNPTNFKYSDKVGNVAVLNIQFNKNSYSNNRNLIYLRKDLFDQLKVKSGYRFIYRVHGERRFARPESLGGADAYKEFEVLGVELRG